MATESRKGIRQGKILAALEANPALRVNQLADELKVSTETIRRDFAELQGTGRLNRTYGGAVAASNRFEPVLADRMAMLVAERRAIARAAAARYGNEAALLLGGGATMLHFARALRAISHRLTVITPSYPVAVELSANPLIEVMLLPGLLEPQEHIVYGSETLRAIRSYSVSTAIIGASGLHRDGISEALLVAGEVYAALLERADHVAVLADHGKFDKRALVALREWGPTTTLLTDEPPPPALAAALAQAGTEVVLCRPGEG